MKLFDNLDFRDEAHLLQYFDSTLHIDFVNYLDQHAISAETLESIIDSYNLTPPNFQSLDDISIARVLK